MPTRWRRTTAAFVVALIVCAAFAASAHAATYTAAAGDGPTTACPNPSAGGCTLRQLILYENAHGSNPPDTILVPAGTDDLAHGALVITRSVSILGAGARSTTVGYVRNPATDRVFLIQVPAANAVPSVVMSGLTITGGVAPTSGQFAFYGGDVRNQGTLVLSEDWITNGTSPQGSGGGISNDGGTLTVTHSLVSGNTSTCCGGDSGGIQNHGPNPVTNGAGKLIVDNSTISNNTAALGGGIMSWGDDSDSVTITNSTIAFNNGGSRNAPPAGGLLASDGQISVSNSIVASNVVANPSGGTTPSNCGTSGNGTIRSTGYNLESSTDCGFTGTGDLQQGNPQFASSAPVTNGGNTDSLAVVFTSPVVDHIPATAAGCSGTDQRDVSRPQGSACDIGAFEFTQPPEGSQFSGAVAIAGCAVSSQPPPSINWGDGQTSSPTVPPSGRTGPLSGSHTYAEEGKYPVVVSWTDDCGAHTNRFSLTVPDAPLSAVPVPVSATAGSPFSGRVAVFSDADPGGTPSDYSATINWGDGTSSAGTINTVGGLAVNGSHTYARPGSYPIAVTIADSGGASKVANGTATVAPVQPNVAPGPPTVQSTSATFAAQVNPEGSATTARWEYGLDASERGPGFSGNVFDQSTPSQALPADFANHAVSVPVTNLLPNARYHVRFVASNGVGTTFGPDQVFTTPPAPAPPPPVIGKTENFAPSGTVFVLKNGQFVKLTQALQLPAGTVVDTRKGSVSLTAATGGVGPATDAKAKKGKKKIKTFTGTFGGAVFKVTQARSGPDKGLTTLTLVENGTGGTPSSASCRAKGAADLHIALSGRILQTLRSRASGRFRTRGRYAAGTVRGTRWTTTDRCDGTLIAVQQHSVLVTDLVKHKTILVRAGQHYLAKAPTHKKHK